MGGPARTGAEPGDPLGWIVGWVTEHLPAGEPDTNVPCWRSPGRKRCRGDMVAERSDGSSEIVWQCPACGANGVIHGWEGSLWDRGSGICWPVDVHALKTGDESPASVSHGDCVSCAVNNDCMPDAYCISVTFAL